MRIGCKPLRMNSTNEMADSTLSLQVLPAGPLDTNAYLLTDTERGEALLIDAPVGVAPYISKVLKREGLRLVALLLTHGHWDHIADASSISALGAVVYGHKDDKDWYDNPMVMSVTMPEDLVIEPVHGMKWLEDGQTLWLMGQEIQILHVPGHAPGSVAFYFPLLGTAFVGDAIFAGSIGRTDLPGGDFKTLESSIRGKIYTLPKNTMLCPGHGQATTVGQEKAHNPFVKG